VDKVIIPPTCAHCGGSDIKLRRQLTTSGVSFLAWRCLVCDRWAENPVRWLKHDLIIPRLERQGVTLDDIPLVADNSQELVCAVCGAHGVSEHHWAPQSMRELFGSDWHNYPTDYLCKKHHELWHALVTPELTTWTIPIREKEQVYG
jgi:hypothetical protein